MTSVAAEDVVPERTGDPKFSFRMSRTEVVKQMVLLDSLKDRILPLEMVDRIVTEIVDDVAKEEAAHHHAEA